MPSAVLDPEAAALLDALARTGPAALVAAAGVPTPEPVESVLDRAIDGPSGPLLVRVYRPAAGGALPIVVFFHGGGWVIGNLDTHDDMCRVLANRSQAVVVSVDYRLTPAHPFPAAADDALAATAWAVEHAEELGGDDNRVAVAGDSAGGNLAAVTALRARDGEGPHLCFQLLFYPMLDPVLDRPSAIEFAEGFLVTTDEFRGHWARYLRSPEAAARPDAVPFKATTLAGLPPALVVTAECDPLRDEGEDYARCLDAAGVPAVARRYDGMVHGFVSFRHTLAAGDRALGDAAEALRVALGSA